MDFGVVTEGNYLIVDKNLVEFFALAILAIFPAGAYLGIDRYIAYWRENRGKGRGGKPAEPSPGAASPAPASFGRRELLMSLAGAPVLGAFTIAVLRKMGWESGRKAAARGGGGAVPARPQDVQFHEHEGLKGQVPHTALGSRTQRSILGGNLSGAGEARDLIYVSKRRESVSAGKQDLRDLPPRGKMRHQRLPHQSGPVRGDERILEAGHRQDQIHFRLRREGSSRRSHAVDRQRGMRVLHPRRHHRYARPHGEGR